ncbi:hypothetical protein [Tropicimonas sp. IMCC6043]|uniref:DMP19 family protein n=1 Tax=Tropicimonas sp. IMCC6043 TaxID=2510645 RepID=UPI00101C479D|nr:hypothetical protein [Tropicimonas sp. IMCC6043]RYH09758.1 hypothetical protein EU800_10980 [Tropicimonas sp. IMCC6043]
MLKGMLSRFHRHESAPEIPQEVSFHQSQIVLRRSVVDAAKSNPEGLVSAVSDFVNCLVEDGHFRQDELPFEAILARQCYDYHVQVLRGGHSWFVRRAMRHLPETLGEIDQGLRALNAQAHREIFGQMQTWIAMNPKNVTTLTGFINGIAPELQKLDSPFRVLSDLDSLVVRIADWITTLPSLAVVEDEAHPAAMRAILASHPDFEKRRTTRGIARTDMFLSDETHLGLGMVAASLEPPEPTVHMGGSWHLTIGPERVEPCYWMRTSAGHRFGAALEEGYTLFEAVPDPAMDRGEPISPEELEKIENDDIDAIQFHKPHAVGRRLAVIAPEMADIAKRACRELLASYAIDLLFRRLPRRVDVTCVSVHRIRRDPDGKPEAVIMIVADKGQMGATVIVNYRGARLVSEPTHETILSVTRAEIWAHRLKLTKS